MTGARVNGPDFIGHGEIHDPIHNQRSRRDSAAGRIAAAGELIHPGETQGFNILIIDLSQAAETPARVVAVVCRPGVRWSDA